MLKSCSESCHRGTLWRMAMEGVVVGGGNLAYWERWQVLLCAIIFAVPTIASVYYLSKLKTPHLRALDLWFPCWAGVHPLWLLGFRGVAFLALISIFFTVLRHSVYEMFFYTQWTFGLVTVYFMLGTLLSAQGCWKYSKQSYRDESEERNVFLEDTRRDITRDIESPVNSQNEPTEDHNKLTLGDNEQRAGWLGYVMQITYQVCAGSAVLTDIVFWIILAPSLTNGQFGLLEGCMHSLNIVFLLLDMSLNSLPFPFFRIAYFILWTCAYGIFQWILHACGVSWWPYPFMDLASPWAPLWYFLIAFVQLPCYGLCFSIAKVKNTLFPKLFRHSYIKSH